MNPNNSKAPAKMVKLCGVYKNKRQKDNKTYLAGRLSFSSKLLILPNPEKTGPNDGQPDFNVLIVEDEAKPREGRTFGNSVPESQAVGDFGGDL